MVTGAGEVAVLRREERAPARALDPREPERPRVVHEGAREARAGGTAGLPLVSPARHERGDVPEHHALGELGLEASAGR